MASPARPASLPNARPNTPGTETYRLRLPGPTAVPERVRVAMARPMLAHRGPEFKALYAEAIELARPLFGTMRNRILVQAASGTGMMETALVNVVAPGERLIVIENGQFGERFSAIGRALGASVDPIVVPWGEAVDPAQVEKLLRAGPARAVVMVHNESSTGVVADLGAIGTLLQDRETLLVVDSVSGLGGIAVDQDRAGVDVIVTGSQKALMCPPGLGLISVSEKAWPVIARESGLPRFYLDLRRARDADGKGETAFTGPVSLVYALHEAMQMIAAEGVENVFARHRRLNGALRAGGAAIGLKGFARTPDPSATVAVFHVPEGLDGTLIVRTLYERHRTVIAGARNRLSGKVLRIGTMGGHTASDILTDLAHLEDVLASLGHRLERGAGVAAAARLL